MTAIKRSQTKTIVQLYGSDDLIVETTFDGIMIHVGIGFKVWMDIAMLDQIKAVRKAGGVGPGPSLPMSVATVEKEQRDIFGKKKAAKKPKVEKTEGEKAAVKPKIEKIESVKPEPKPRVLPKKTPFKKKTAETIERICWDD